MHVCLCFCLFVHTGTWGHDATLSSHSHTPACLKITKCCEFDVCLIFWLIINMFILSLRMEIWCDMLFISWDCHLFFFIRPSKEWPCPSVRPSTIACEHDILKTTCLIGFTFWYGLNTTTTLVAVDFGHSTKTKMAATAVWRLTLYPIQNIACECGRLKTAFRIDFIFWFGLNTTNTSDAIDLGHSTKTKMAATAVWRLTLYPMQDISCERGRLKTA